jgi:hypothetical protein
MTQPGEVRRNGGAPELSCLAVEAGTPGFSARALKGILD